MTLPAANPSVVEASSSLVFGQFFAARYRIEMLQQQEQQASGSKNPANTGTALRVEATASATASASTSSEGPSTSHSQVPGVNYDPEVQRQLNQLSSSTQPGS